MVDERVLAEDLATRPMTADAAALQETYFEMPVRLAVEGVELLEITAVTTSPWLPLPLLDVALMVPDLLDHLAHEASGTYSLPGGGWSLRIRRNGSEVELESTVNGRRTIASYKELRAAAFMFRERVRSLMKSRVPRDC